MQNDAIPLNYMTMMQNDMMLSNFITMMQNDTILLNCIEFFSHFFQALFQFFLNFSLNFSVQLYFIFLFDHGHILDFFQFFFLDSKTAHLGVLVYINSNASSQPFVPLCVFYVSQNLVQQRTIDLILDNVTQLV